jgi:hypothetical protein
MYGAPNAQLIRHPLSDLNALPAAKRSKPRLFGMCRPQRVHFAPSEESPHASGIACEDAIREAKGEPIDTKNIRKHANDVLRLSQLLAPDTRIPVAERIAQDLNRFLDAIETDRSIDPKSLKINSSVGEIAERIARAYGLNRPRET